MSLSALSSASLSPAVTTMALVKLANGEYSAASVATDPTEANRLGLIRVKDGNYASLLFAGVISGAHPAAATSSSAVQSALSSLVLGG